MSQEPVRYEVDDGVAVLTLSAPPANCTSWAMMKALDGAILEARFDDSVEVIVITGDGDRFFSAGADIEMLSSVTPSFKYYFCLHTNETLLRLEHTPKLVIAAINGHCVGGGLEIALAADLRVARKDCGSWGVPEVKLGVLPGTGGTQRLTRLVGRQRALRWMLEGHVAPMAEALEAGVIDRIEDVDADAFVQAVKRWARSFTPPRTASRAVGAIKRAVQSGSELPLEQGLVLERELQARLFTTDDAIEGLGAFLEKRKPRFSGS